MRNQLVDRILAGQPVDWTEVDELRGMLAAEVFGGNGWECTDAAQRGDPRVDIVIDLFQAMMLLHPAEPAFPWNLGGLLTTLGRHEASAIAFLRAAELLRRGKERGTVEDDELDEWEEAARAYACRAFVRAGRRLCAAVLWQGIADDDYQENLREWVAEGEDPGLEVGWVPHPLWLSSGEG